MKKLIKNRFKFRETLQLFVVAVVLFIVLVSAIGSTFEGYYGFYYDNAEYTECHLSKITNNISRTSLFRFFSVYTGFNTGYGFFAPNVASDFVFVFKIYDHENKLIQIQQGVPFNSKESEVRFGTIGTMYLEKLNDKDHKNYDEKYNKYLDVTINEITEYVRSTYAEKGKVECSIFLYDYPDIFAYKTGDREKLYLIKKCSL
tara:strand:+ start:84 stop:689 length:606 start_codon:yes stop_codon:yes gene_type:complete